MSYKTTVPLPMLYGTVIDKMESYKHSNKFLRSTAMMSKIPMTWTGIQMALAGASAYVVCTTDLLRGAAIFLH